MIRRARRLEFYEALNLVVDDNLRQCLEHNSGWDNNRDVASDITQVGCGWNNVQTLEGLEPFTGIKVSRPARQQLYGSDAGRRR